MDKGREKAVIDNKTKEGVSETPLIKERRVYC